MPSQTQDAAIGAVFDGRYRIDALLGRGGMGAVYRAHQLAVGRDVAVKLLHPTLSADAATVSRFENEAKVIAGLRHPNTIKLVDVGRLPDARIFIVTELVEGRTLDERFGEGLPLAQAISILSQVCDALIEAHQRGVVHRDLKPGNVMVERIGAQEVAKVLDFGIAKLAAQPKVTATGTIFGTPAYMSPEQAKGEAVDGRTDIYALGIMLYEAATGRLPFESTSPGALMVKHISEEPTPPSDRLQEGALPPLFEDLILQMLEKDPEDRPQSLEEVRRRLTDPKLLDDPGPGPEATSESERVTDGWTPSGIGTTAEVHSLALNPPPGTRRSRALLGLALILLGLGGWWAWTGAGDHSLDTQALDPRPPAEAEALDPRRPKETEAPARTERPPPMEPAEDDAAQTESTAASVPDPTPRERTSSPPKVSPSPDSQKQRPRRRPRPVESKQDPASPVTKPPAKTPTKAKPAPPTQSSPVPPGLQDVEL